MKSYRRLMLGKKSVYAKECFEGNYIGVDFGIDLDVAGDLTDQWREFNRRFIPIYLDRHPGKTRVAAGLACGTLWTVAKGMRNSDVVLAPDGTGRYRVGEIDGDYYYSPGAHLPHRRPVRWLPQVIDRSDMSDPLRNSTGSIATLSDVTPHQVEIERLIGTAIGLPPAPADDLVEDVAAFALEKHLEDFLIQNWAQTELSKGYDIYEVDGERVGQQYPTDTGPIDILAISRDRQQLLVIELKKGRASDAVVGQVLRYMGYIRDEVAEPTQRVAGVIVAAEDDQRIRRALSVTPSVDFYRFRVSFQLVKASAEAKASA